MVAVYAFDPRAQEAETDVSEFKATLVFQANQNYIVNYILNYIVKPCLKPTTTPPHTPHQKVAYCTFFFLQVFFFLFLVPLGLGGASLAQKVLLRPIYVQCIFSGY